MHQVRVAVHPGGKHATAIRIHHLEAGPIGNARKISHGPTIHDPAILDGQPSVLQHGHPTHVRSGQTAGGRLSKAHEGPDVLDQQAA